MIKCTGSRREELKVVMLDEMAAYDQARSAVLRRLRPSTVKISLLDNVGFHKINILVDSTRRTPHVSEITIDVRLDSPRHSVETAVKTHVQTIQTPSGNTPFFSDVTLAFFKSEIPAIFLHGNQVLSPIPGL
jgi:hypothetical protein